MDLPAKKDVLLTLLVDTWVHLGIDPRVAGVELPEWLCGDPSVALQIGYNMPVPIPDLTIDDEGVQCTLSFRRTPFLCRIPWRAIYSIIDTEGNRGVVYPDDIPPELLRAAAPPAATPEPEPAEVTPLRPGTSSAEVTPLRAVAAKMTTTDDAPPPPAPASPRGKRPRPSHLKLVD